MGRLKCFWLLLCLMGLVACSGSAAPTLTVGASAAASARPTEVPTRVGLAVSPSVVASMRTPSATAMAASPSRVASPSVGVAGATATRGNCPLTRSMNGTGVSQIGSPPMRSSVGQGHVLSGMVRSARDCAPLAGATLVFWLAGPDGKYAPAYEATVFTDGNGAYRFESTYPGTYEGTSPHIHMFVSAEGHYGIETVYGPGPNQTAGTYDITLAVK